MQRCENVDHNRFASHHCSKEGLAYVDGHYLCKHHARRAVRDLAFNLVIAVAENNRPSGDAFGKCASLIHRLMPVAPTEKYSFWDDDPPETDTRPVIRIDDGQPKLLDPAQVRERALAIARHQKRKVATLNDVTEAMCEQINTRIVEAK